MRKKSIILIMILIITFSLYSLVEARAWGGWSSSWWWDVGWLVVAWLIYAIYEIRRRKMIKKAKKDLENALKEDSSWDIKLLKEVTKKVFLKYQNCRGEKNLEPMETYMTKSYYKKANKIMDRKLKWRINILKDIYVRWLTLMSVKDVAGRDWDMFAIEVEASMIDYTINEKTWVFISSTNKRHKSESKRKYVERSMKFPSEFKEYYIFIRHNWKWLLNNIKPKFSIVWDIIKLSEKDLRKILKDEKESDYVNDDMLYQD